MASRRLVFGGAIDAMVRAREHDRAPFDVLDEEIGWDRLVPFASPEARVPTTFV